jgi:CRISPR/Cas system CSM-associated protein Csm3 (group 7 of RAMP superfamily)
VRIVTPTAVGSTQERPDGQAAVVEPFLLDGRPAIPASSLRGMISSLAEAASNSALRILDKTTYSYHKGMRHPRVLSAIGMILPVQGGSGFGLFPLAIPTLREQSGVFRLPARFESCYPSPVLRVYVGHADDHRGDDQHIKRKTFQYVTSNPPDVHRANVTPVEWRSPNDFSLEPQPQFHTRNGLLLGQRTKDEVPPVHDSSGGWSGYMRVLGCWESRLKDIPRTKKHELFLPHPHHSSETWPIKPISQRVLDRFHALSDERTIESVKARERHPNRPLLPFHPLDRPRGGPEDTVRLQQGDLVYFDVNDDGQISEVSFSAIWRDYVWTPQGEAAGAHHFFAGIDPELLPFSASRAKITPAEQLFGFATEDKRADDLRSYMGRVRFTDAHIDTGNPLAADPLLRSVPLKILSSPKPPCPAMYFQPGPDGMRVEKHALTPGVNHPQGRKFYLHHFVPEGVSPWKTQSEENVDQKVSITPIRPGLTFTFEVQFDNLSEDDLGLLLYSLAPESEFHHKLGMGKSLGLGSIKLTIEACEKIDRSRRYSIDGLISNRFLGGLDWSDLRDRYRRIRVSPGIQNALRLLGTVPANGNIPVTGPTIEPDPDLRPAKHPEKDTFQWFVANDAGLTSDRRHYQIPTAKKALRPLRPGDTELPTLDRYQWTPKH